MRINGDDVVRVQVLQRRPLKRHVPPTQHRIRRGQQQQQHQPPPRHHACPHRGECRWQRRGRHVISRCRRPSACNSGQRRRRRPLRSPPRPSSCRTDRPRWAHRLSPPPGLLGLVGLGVVTTALLGNARHSPVSGNLTRQ